MVRRILESFHRGQMMSFAHWFQICFYFFLTLSCFLSKFKKQSKDPLVKKIVENRFLISQKNYHEKCWLKVKLFLFKYWFFYIDLWTKKYQKIGILKNFDDLGNFQYFLVQNFHKKNKISLSNFTFNLYFSRYQT